MEKLFPTGNQMIYPQSYANENALDLMGYKTPKTNLAMTYNL